MSKIELIEPTEKPRKRLFEAGEMKLLVLHFISQQPKYSYDIIKDVSALVGGDYKPSTGTICPTINYLEDNAFTVAHMTADDRKQYHITEKGLAHLVTQQQALKKVLCRFNARHHIQNNAEYLEIKTAMEALKRALRHNLQNAPLSDEQITTIANSIHQAAKDITQLADQEMNA